MLFLLFQLGRERYALEAQRVLEVLSIVNLKPLPHAPKGIAGVVHYRGRAVPAVDLSQLRLGRPAAQRLGTRIVLTQWPNHSRGHTMGLITEGPLELLSSTSESFARPKPVVDQAPDLSCVALDRSGPVQRFSHETLLPQPMQELLRSATPWPALDDPESLPLHQARDSSRVSAVIFRLEQEWLALPTPLLEQVAQRRPIHSLPHRPQGLLLGLANIRGELIMCFSLSHLLELRTTSSCESLRADHRRLLVVNWEGKRLAFPVAEAHGPDHFHADQLGKPPATGLNYTRSLLSWKQRAVGLLDPERLFPTLQARLK